MYVFCDPSGHQPLHCRKTRGRLSRCPSSVSFCNLQRAKCPLQRRQSRAQCHRPPPPKKKNSIQSKTSSWPVWRSAHPLLMPELSRRKSSVGRRYRSLGCELSCSAWQRSPVDQGRRQKVLVSVPCCFTSTETVRTIRDGESLQDGHSTFTQLLSSGQIIISIYTCKLLCRETIPGTQMCTHIHTGTHPQESNYWL